MFPRDPSLGLAKSAPAPYADIMISQVVSSRLALIPLLGLTLFFPFLQDAFPFFAHGDGVRELVCVLELAFLASALFERDLCLPEPLSFSKTIRWTLGIWIVWSVAATLLSEHGARALVRQSEWFLHGLTAAVLWAWLRAHPLQIRRIAAAIPIGFLVLSSVIAAELFWDVRAKGGADIPGFENIRHYGYYAVIAIGYLTAVFAGSATTTSKTVGAFLALSASWTLLVWTGSRGATFAAVGALGVLWLLKIDRKWNRCIALAAVAILLGAGLSTLLPRVTPSHGIQRILRHTGLWGEIPTHTTTTNFITNGRTDLWSTVAPQTLEAPWFGHGPDGYLFSGAMGTRSEQPHNVFLQFVFEWGFIGACAMVALLFFVLRRQIWRVRALGRRSEPDDDQAARLGALAALLGLSLQSLVDGTFHHSFSLALGAISLAIVAQPRRDTPVPPPQQMLRAGYCVVTGALACVFVLNTWVMVALSNAALPEPEATRTQIVRAFPSRIESVGEGSSVFYWANYWSKNDPQLAIDWLHFGHLHARQPWRFYQLEGRLLMAQGDREAARKHFEKAIEHSYQDDRRELSQRFLDANNAELGN
jgi:O-antigen ligase